MIDHGLLEEITTNFHEINETATYTIEARSYKNPIKRLVDNNIIVYYDTGLTYKLWC